jgi:very-short-patch-repair endonuclease
MKFRRQHVIDAFVTDFYCHDARLVIELDGPIHDGRRDEDGQRQRRLENIGYHVLRFPNHEVLDDPEAILLRITEAIGPIPPPRRPLSPGERGWGEGSS